MAAFASENRETLVTIGLPVYNGAATIVKTLDSLLVQTYGNFELIISDNASTDTTAAICRDYATRDSRIRFIQQPSNLGAAANFKFVLDQAITAFFVWVACDDTWSENFLEENVESLRGNSDFVASTSPNCSQGKVSEGTGLVTFAITGSVEDRFEVFLDNCWESNAIFYSLMRTEVIKQCEVVGQHILGSDWAIDLFLASHGNVHRTEKGLLILGRDGLSNSDNRWSAFREPRVGWIFPFYRVSIYAMKWSSGFALPRRVGLIWRLLKLNAYAARKQLKFELRLLYRAVKMQLS